MRGLSSKNNSRANVISGLTLRLALVAVSSLSLFQGCSSDPSTDEPYSGVSGEPGIPGGVGIDYQTRCGVPVGGELKNPVNSDLGETTVVEDVPASNLLVVRGSAGPRVIALQGVAAASPDREQVSTRNLKNIIQGQTVTLFPAQNGCRTGFPGGQAESATVVNNATGASVAEIFLSSGLSGEADSQCDGALLVGCYAGIKAEAPLVNAGQVNDFLWKPSSEGGWAPGTLAIHFSTVPSGTDTGNDFVTVDKVRLTEFPTGNGFDYLFRYLGRNGCSFRDAVVEIFNEAGLPYTFPDGNTFLVIGNGCARYEY